MGSEEVSAEVKRKAAEAGEQKSTFSFSHSELKGTVEMLIAGLATATAEEIRGVTKSEEEQERIIGARNALRKMAYRTGYNFDYNTALSVGFDELVPTDNLVTIATAANPLQGHARHFLEKRRQAELSQVKPLAPER